MRVQRSFKAAMTGRTVRLIAAAGMGVVLSGALLGTAHATPAGTGTEVEKKLTAVVINATPGDGESVNVPVFAQVIGGTLAYCVKWGDAVEGGDLYHAAAGNEAAIDADKSAAVTAILANGFAPGAN